MSELIVIGLVAADWGPIRIAASSRGLVAVDQLVAADAFAERLERRFGEAPIDGARAPAGSAAAAHLAAGVAALEAFVAGNLAALDSLPIDLAGRTSWDHLVLGAVRGIPPGSTASYGEVARMIGKAGAARAVGGAVGRNPLGLVIPCHRVIAGDGSLGGYGGGWWGGRAQGLALKRELLAREGITIPPEFEGEFGPLRPVDSAAMFKIFRKRDFSLLWMAQLVSTIGSSLTDLAAGILVFKITGSALNVGLVLMVTALPTLFVGLFAGVFVDRFNRKRILLASDLLRGLLVLMIPFGFIYLGDNGGMIAMYGILFVAATVRQFFDPAWESVLPEIASEEELISANAFLSISSFGSTAVGFALAGLLAGVDIHLPFFIDSGTFAFSFVLVALVRIPGHAAQEEATTVGVIVDNLKVGASYLWHTKLLRWLFLINLPVMLSFGLWNVLLLPMAIRVLHASDFEYGLQEGVTSVGFVVGSLLMARFGDRLPEGTWMVAGTLFMGIFGVLYGNAPNIQVAIVLVTFTGFLNSPMSIARRGLLQKNIPRAMRGRVFSAFAVSRDVIFLIGMGGAALADIYPVRDLIIVSSLLLIGAAIIAQLAPGIGRTGAEWRHALQLLATAPVAARVGAGRAATMMDFDRLLRVMPEIGALAMNRRAGFISGIKVARAEPGEAILKVGDPGDLAYFVMGGKAIAGIPDQGGYRALSSMGPGDFFGEIAALTGSTRTANVVADEETDLIEVPSASLKELLEIPELHTLINSKLEERLGRTSTSVTDLVRVTRPNQTDLKDLRKRRPKGTAGQLA